MSNSHPVRFARLLPLLAAGALLVGVTTVWAVDATNTDQTGLALNGYDPVAHCTRGEPTKGDFQITEEHDGAVYRFANEHHRELFRKNPQRYVPRYGGYCAYGVSVGKKFSADPTVWKIVDGRLYLNLDESIAEKFNEDITGHINQADQNWKKLAEEPAR